MCTIALQGVFVDDAAGGLRIVPNPEPSDFEVATLLASVSRRIARLAKRHGIELDRPSEEIDRLDPLASESPLFAGICRASVLGQIATGRRAGQPVLRIGGNHDAPLVALSGERHAHISGFDLHGNVAVPAGDNERLEHLCRYVLRPPVAQDGLELTGDGKILLSMRRAWHDGTRAVLFEPHELIEKLAALVPKPRINLLLYHGVLGPSARLRGAAVAGARESKLANDQSDGRASLGSAARGSFEVDQSPRGAIGSRSQPRPHAAWADLLRRTFEIDVLACPEWGGRLRFLATIEDPAVVGKILSHLGIPGEHPQPVPARSAPSSPERFDFQD